MERQWSSLSIQICRKKGINPTILLWGWDWDQQTYSREGYGSLGLFIDLVFLFHHFLTHMCWQWNVTGVSLFMWWRYMNHPPFCTRTIFHLIRTPPKNTPLKTNMDTPKMIVWKHVCTVYILSTMTIFGIYVKVLGCTISTVFVRLRENTCLVQRGHPPPAPCNFRQGGSSTEALQTAKFLRRHF